MERLFTIEECENIIEFAEKINLWNERKENDPDGNLFAWYYVESINDHKLASEKFKKYINEKFSFSVDSVNMYILKYLPGFKFGRHFDRQKHLEFNMDFVYNINVVLNDYFEGGEFWLDDKLMEGNSPGMVYHYDSTQWHEVKPIISGVRYSVICYVRERDFIKKKNRSLL